MNRILTLVTLGLGRPPMEELMHQEAADRYPRSTLYQRTVNSDILDEHYLQNLSPARQRMYRYFPGFSSQVIEAYRIRRRYDAIVSWAAQLGLPLAFLLRLTGDRPPHIVLDNWISRPKKARLLRLTASGIDRLILWSTVQRNYAINVIGFPPEKISLLTWYVDQKFFRPLAVPLEPLISSVGSEMRDYPTLINAIRNLGISCHIAAGTLRDQMTETVKAIWKDGPLPDGITVGFKTYPELRELYARSRFIVVPLHQTDTDNGISAILEAMAMGKAVVCTRTEGQVDIVEDGKSGIMVPPYDSNALREAIKYLWNHPEIAESMGARGRMLVERQFNVDRFVTSIGSIIRQVVEEHSSYGKLRFRKARSEQSVPRPDADYFA